MCGVDSCAICIVHVIVDVKSDVILDQSVVIIMFGSLPSHPAFISDNENYRNVGKLLFGFISDNESYRNVGKLLFGFISDNENYRNVGNILFGFISDNENYRNVGKLLFGVYMHMNVVLSKKI